MYVPDVQTSAVESHAKGDRDEESGKVEYAAVSTKSGDNITTTEMV